MVAHSLESSYDLDRILERKVSQQYQYEYDGVLWQIENENE